MRVNAGAAPLLRLAPRRDRIMIPVWLVVLAGFVLSTASAYRGLYDDASSRHDFAEGINSNGSTLALYGPVHGESIGGLTTWRMSGIGTVLLLMLTGSAAGLTYGLAVGDVGGKVPELLGGGLVQVPAAWVLAGIALALFGLAPGCRSVPGSRWRRS